MPTPSAAEVFPADSGCPAIVTVPSAAVSAPETSLMRVDLPAPFSPTRAGTSPGRTSKSTPSSARTPPYRLRMPVSLSSGSLSVMDPPSAPPRALRGGRARSVVVLVDVVLGDLQRVAEQDLLLLREVLHRGQLGVDLVGRLQRGALVDLDGRPGGQVAELLDVPQDRGAGGAVREVGLHRLGRADADREDLADLARLPDRLGHAGRRRGALADQAGEVRMGVDQVLGHG